MAEALKTIVVVGIGGDVVINERDLSFYKNQGYKLKDEVDAANKATDAGRKLISVDQLDVPRLRELAMAHGVEEFDTMKKKELINALSERGITQTEVG